MIGKEFGSEISNYKDKKTGCVVKRLTDNSSNNFHLYFTDNSFTLGDKEIYFLSDRSKPDIYNFFKMDLSSGKIIQLTDETSGIFGHPTKSPDSEIIIYFSDNKVKMLNTRTGRSEVIFEESGEYRLASPFISPDKKYLGIPRNENVKIRRGPNYKGFKFLCNKKIIDHSGLS